MTQQEHIDHLEARVIAHEIALRTLLQYAPAEARDWLDRAAASVPDQGLIQPLTDLQLEQIQQCLQSMR